MAIPFFRNSSSASNWHEARVPVNRKRLKESSYFTGSPVDYLFFRAKPPHTTARRRGTLREFALEQGNSSREDTRRGGREEARGAVVRRKPNRSFRSIPNPWLKNS